MDHHTADGGAPEETEVVLNDGTRVYIRPLRPGDEDLVRAGLTRLSVTSRYRRFMTGVSNLTDAELRYLTDVDGVDHAAFGAGVTAPDGSLLGIGTARYIRSASDPSEADFAVTVVDDHQRIGVASALLDVLGDHARHNGIRRLTAEMLAENTAIQELIRRRGGTVSRTDQPSIVNGFLDLDVARPEG